MPKTLPIAILLILSLAIPPGIAFGQTPPPQLPATIEAMEGGGLFFPGSEPETVIAGQQVAAEVNLDVSGTIVRATVRQTFANPYDQWIEAVYVFPLPENAAVDRLTIDLGERVIDGRIEEREVAEKQFAEPVRPVRPQAS